MRAVEATADWAGRALIGVAGAALLVLMTLTFVDVVGRKFFVPVPGALEISEMLMVVVLFAGLPLVAWHAEHASFELTDQIYRGWSAAWSRAFMDGFCAVVFGALALACWRFAERTLEEGEVTAYLRWPVGGFVYLIAVLIGVTAIMHALRMLTKDWQDLRAEPPQ
jgi:TRAP-type C4-dicarboxylate transport system permease small subunit